MNPNRWRCGGAGSYLIAIITGNGEWSSVQKHCPDCSPSPEYLEASRTLGRNAMVETDAPEVIAAARAVCDAATGIERRGSAGRWHLIDIFINLDDGINEVTVSVLRPGYKGWYEYTAATLAEAVTAAMEAEIS